MHSICLLDIVSQSILYIQLISSVGYSRKNNISIISCKWFPFSILVTSAIRYANSIYSSYGSYGSYSYTCSGSESQLINCTTTLTARSCIYRYRWSRRNVAGVRCYSKHILVATLITGIQVIYNKFLSLVVNSGCTEGDVRLAGGETVMEGRVEVCHNQIWWAVSTSSYWGFRDATVVCRHLHYPANCEWCNTTNH